MAACQSKKRDRAAIMVAGAYVGKADVERAKKAFEGAADIEFGHVLYRYFDVAIDRPDRPALRRYYGRLTERPAFREHVMVSYEELRVI